MVSIYVFACSLTDVIIFLMGIKLVPKIFSINLDSPRTFSPLIMDTPKFHFITNVYAGSWG